MFYFQDGLIFVLFSGWINISVLFSGGINICFIFRMD